MHRVQSMLALLVLAALGSSGCSDDSHGPADSGPRDKGSAREGLVKDGPGPGDKTVVRDKVVVKDKVVIMDKATDGPGLKDKAVPPDGPAIASWVVAASGPKWEQGSAVAVDSLGNVLVCGEFSPTLAIGGLSLTAVGGKDLFILKLDPSGKALWAASAGGTNGDSCAGLAVDAAGNVYITGTILGAATFGSINLPGSGSTNKTYVAKLSPGGSFLWAKQASDTKNNNGTGIATDAAGNSFVVGKFISTVTFGSHTVTNSQVVNYELYVARVNSSGTFLWAIHGSGTVSEARDVTVDSAGDAYVTGDFDWSMKLGSTSLAATAASNVFLAKVNSGGAFVWATSAGGQGTTSWSSGQAVAVNSSGVTVSGTFNPSITIGSKVLQTSGSFDVFVARYSSAGAPVWAISGGSSSADTGYDLAVDPGGATFLLATVDGAGAFGSKSYASFGGTDVAVVGLSTGGAFTSVQVAGGSQYDKGYGIARDSKGALLVTGEFYSTATFGSQKLTAAGSSDGFVWKMVP